MDPGIVLTVRDADGEIVRRLSGPTDKGIHRVAWDLRYPAPDPVSLEEKEPEPFEQPPIGPLAVPGTYTVSLERRSGGEATELAGPVPVIVEPLALGVLPAADRAALTAFQRETAGLQRAVLGAVQATEEMRDRVAHLRKAALDTANGDPAWLDTLDELATRLADLEIELKGDPTLADRSEPTPPASTDRVAQVVSGHWTSTSAPTATHRRNYEIAAEAFEPVLEGLRGVDADLEALEGEMDAAGAPWTPGRLPQWRR